MKLLGMATFWYWLYSYFEEGRLQHLPPSMHMHQDVMGGSLSMRRNELLGGGSSSPRAETILLMLFVQ